jgi:hypothetical protein
MEATRLFNLKRPVFPFATSSIRQVGTEYLIVPDHGRQDVQFETPPGHPKGA